MTLIRRSVLAITAVCVLGTTLPLPAMATADVPPGLVTTDEVLAEPARAARSLPNDRGATVAKLDALLARDEVRAALAARGVDATQVHARVAALTDDEARHLAAEMDRLPAGGDVLGYVFLVFVILLITDILGFTKVFPFTKPVR